jgi:protein-arginine kinase activator protein McsA
MTRLGNSPAEREILQAELEQAVAAEDYERAARIRDRLAALNRGAG